MTWLSVMFQQGGFTMLWIEYISPLALAFAILHLVVARRWSAFVSVAAILIVLGVGIYGRQWGRGMTDDAVASMPSGVENRAEIQEQGYIEASRPIQFAGLVAGVLGVLVIIGELRRRGRRRAA